MMIKKVSNALLFILVVVGLSGCMKYAPSIGTGDVLVPAKGYLYGRFSSEPGSNFGAKKTGIVVTSVDNKREIAMRFVPNRDPYAVAVDPGDYQATHIVYTIGWGNEKKGETPFPKELSSRVIHVESGKAYYIGDFDGTTKSTFRVIFVRNEWQVGNITNDFAGTTAKLVELLPQMKNIPKVDVFGDALVSAFSYTDAPKAGALSHANPVLLSPAK